MMEFNADRMKKYLLERVYAHQEITDDIIDGNEVCICDCYICPDKEYPAEIIYHKIEDIENISEDDVISISVVMPDYKRSTSSESICVWSPLMDNIDFDALSYLLGQIKGI